MLRESAVTRQFLNRRPCIPQIAPLLEEAGMMYATSQCMKVYKKRADFGIALGSPLDFLKESDELQVAQKGDEGM